MLSFIEHATPAIHHAVPFVLEALERVQNSFLDTLHLSKLEALTTFKLAPLSTRRDIAMLGFLHRFSHGKAPPCFNDVLQMGTAAALPRQLRQGSFHDLQIRDVIDGSQPRQLERSVLGLVYSFNCLPSDVAVQPDVACFQRCLQRGVVRAARCDRANWENLLRDEVRCSSVASFQAWFI